MANIAEGGLIVAYEDIYKGLNEIKENIWIVTFLSVIVGTALAYFLSVLISVFDFYFELIAIFVAY